MQRLKTFLKTLFKNKAEGLNANIADLRAFQKSIAYTFRDIKLLNLALIHASCKEYHNNTCNERLEFLGDSILGFVVVEYLFKKYPERNEGELTRIKSIVVSKPPLQDIGELIGLGKILKLGRGLQNKEVSRRVIANAMESLIGAIHLDGGIKAARKFILKYLIPEIEKIENTLHKQNFKSLLQTACQREYSKSPIYKVLETRGPEHQKEFQIGVIVNGEQQASSWGENKKSAEQSAAFKTLKRLNLFDTNIMGIPKEQ